MQSQGPDFPRTLHLFEKEITISHPYLSKYFIGTDDYFGMKLCVDTFNGLSCCEIGTLDSAGNNFEAGYLDWFARSDLKDCENFQFPKGAQRSNMSAINVTQPL